jgi:glycosyltransferase involved in cell wall biosynthesis
VQSNYLSIITITHNNPGIETTINSVKSQTTLPLEHIIVDNLSSDNTPQTVAQYQKTAKYPVTYIREADNGRYQAMNKGIKLAKGEYLLFLNAGDSLAYPNILKQVFATPHTADILYGDTNMVESPTKSTRWSLKNFSIDPQFFIDRTLFHQSTFIKKELFEKYGPYDESLKIVGDFEFFIRAIIKHHVIHEYLPLVVSNYDTHGISSTMSDEFLAERAKVITRHYSGSVYFYHFLKYLYYTNKKLVPSWLINIQQQRRASKPKV